MADIVFRYTQMRQAVEDIKEIGSRYESAAETLNTDFTNAIKSWEGDSKEALNSFMTGAVYDYTHTTIPGLMTALADLLEANANSMEKADKEIADNIPQSLS